MSAGMLSFKKKYKVVIDGIVENTKDKYLSNLLAISI